MEGQKKPNYVIIGSVVLVCIVALFGAFKYIKNDASNVSVTTSVPVPNTNNLPQNTPPETTPIDVPKSMTYKDGTYSAKGDYISPGGDEQIEVQVMLKNDIVVDAEVKSLVAQRPNSVKFQGIFIANFRPLVIGKKIDEVALSKVSGSSLTSGGFNAALDKIKIQAKA